MDGLSCKFCTLLSICPRFSIGLPSTASSPPVTRIARPGRGLTFPPVPPDRSGPPSPPLCKRVTLWFSVAQSHASREGPLSKTTMHTDPTISSLDWGWQFRGCQCWRPTSNLRIDHRSTLTATRLVAKILTDGTFCKVSFVSKVMLLNMLL